MLVEIEEFNQFLRNDPISRFVLVALLASRSLVGGERLYSIVKEAVEEARRRGMHKQPPSVIFHESRALCFGIHANSCFHQLRILRHLNTRYPEGAN